MQWWYNFAILDALQVTLPTWIFHLAVHSSCKWHFSPQGCSRTMNESSEAPKSNADQEILVFLFAFQFFECTPMVPMVFLAHEVWFKCPKFGNSSQKHHQYKNWATNLNFHQQHVSPPGFEASELPDNWVGIARRQPSPAEKALCFVTLGLGDHFGFT